jgi:hypothetical protein
MPKYETKVCEGYWEDEPDNIYSVNIAMGDWDGKEDYEDESIFFYMDGEPLVIGAIVADSFVITEIEDLIENSTLEDKTIV